MVQLYSTYHLNSAVHNARIAGEAENEVKEEGLEGRFKNESLRRWQPLHDSHVTTSLILSYAAVEAIVNEIIKQPYRFNIKNERLDKLSSIYPILREGTIPKYQLVLICSDKEPIDTDGQLYEDIRILQKIRNFLIHYEPESWSAERGSTSANLAESLKNKNIDSNPFRPDDTGFGKYVSYDCAKWAFETVMNLFDSTFDKLDGRPPYYAYKDRLREEIKPGWEKRSPNW